MRIDGIDRPNLFSSSTEVLPVLNLTTEDCTGAYDGEKTHALKCGKLSKGVLQQSHTCKILVDAVERNGYNTASHIFA